MKRAFDLLAIARLMKKRHARRNHSGTPGHRRRSSRALRSKRETGSGKQGQAPERSIPHEAPLGGFVDP